MMQNKKRGFFSKKSLTKNNNQSINQAREIRRPSSSNGMSLSKRVLLPGSGDFFHAADSLSCSG